MVSLSKEQRYLALKAIRDELLSFTESSLYAYRTENNYFPVIGEGDHQAEIMFIGEAPGKTEATTGRPFCGRAGKVLDALIESAGLKRADVYITNLIKDRPQDNRDPLPEEIDLYASFLDRQIEIIEPKIIATLGRYSMAYSMKRFGLEDEMKPISQLHGRVFSAQASYGPVKIVALYHPAVAVYNPNLLGVLKTDFLQVVGRKG